MKKTPINVRYFSEMAEIFSTANQRKTNQPIISDYKSNSVRDLYALTLAAAAPIYSLLSTKVYPF